MADIVEMTRLKKFEKIKPEDISFFVESANNTYLITEEVSMLYFKLFEVFNEELKAKKHKNITVQTITDENDVCLSIKNFQNR